jgi:hypothetical protein
LPILNHLRFQGRALANRIEVKCSGLDFGYRRTSTKQGKQNGSHGSGWIAETGQGGMFVRLWVSWLIGFGLIYHRQLERKPEAEAEVHDAPRPREESFQSSHAASYSCISLANPPARFSPRLTQSDLFQFFEFNLIRICV